MELVNLTTIDIERLANKINMYNKFPSYFEIYMRSDDITEVHGIRYYSGGKGDVYSPGIGNHFFEVVDQKKWVMSRLRYGI